MFTGKLNDNFTYDSLIIDKIKKMWYYVAASRLKRFAETREGRFAIATTVGIVHLVSGPSSSVHCPSPPSFLRSSDRFEEAASVQREAAQGNVHFRYLTAKARKSDKALAIITDGAKKWRRGTEGRLADRPSRLPFLSPFRQQLLSVYIREPPDD